jgi:hypothetical protein
VWKWSLRKSFAKTPNVASWLEFPVENSVEEEFWHTKFQDFEITEKFVLCKDTLISSRNPSGGVVDND